MEVLHSLAQVFFPEGLQEGMGLWRPVAEGPQTLSFEERYRTLVEQIPAVVFMASMEGGRGEAYVSPQIEAMLGFTQEEWLNDPIRWYRQIHPQDRGRWNVEAAEMFLTGTPLRSVYRVMARDGKVIWFHCEVKMVRRGDGRPWFIHGVAFDVTELKVAEESLRTARNELEVRVQQRTAELERSNADLEQFAYVASHDLQEPLRVVAGFAKLLGSRHAGKLDGDAGDFLGHIQEGVQRMEKLIHDLLAYSRVGRQGWSPSRTDCEAVLATVKANLEASLSESGAILSADPLPKIWADETQFVQLFQNLIGNAIKFHSQEPPRVHVAVTRKDGEWVFSVEDNGIGIESKYFDKIFTIFQRLHSRKDYSGTGIGLAICKKIVELHGGRIWLESQPGVGSRFFFTIPIR